MYLQAGIPIDDRLEGIIVYAVRYAIGRCTYAVSDVCGFVSGLISHLETNTLRVILRDIEERKDFELGMDCDRKEWRALQIKIRAELEKRDEKS